MFTQIIDIVAGPKQTAKDTETTGAESYIAIIYLAWFSIMLYLALSVM